MKMREYGTEAHGWMYLGKDVGWKFYVDYEVIDPQLADIDHPPFIQLYTEGPCKLIQAYLRAGKLDKWATESCFDLTIDEVVEGIDAEIQYLSAEQDYVPEKVCRADRGYLLSVVDGDGIDKGYTSTTDDKTPIAYGDYWYFIENIRHGDGAMVDEYSRYGEECEFLFKRGTKFRKVKRAGNWIFLKVIHEDDE